MTAQGEVFTVGELYSHEEVYKTLKVGNAGGIRPSVGKDGETRRLVVMTSHPSARIIRENPYHDRIEGDVLVYTAAGLEGDQEFSGQNRRLLDQLAAPFPVYGFYNIGSRRNAALGRRRWKFVGLLQYLRHFVERQIDVRGHHRNSMVFELLIHSEPAKVAVAHDREISARVCSKPREATEREVQTEAPPASGDLTRIDPVTAEKTRRSLLTIPPERFEHVVKEALESSGFENVKVTRYTSDGGIDVNAYAGPSIWPYRGGLLQVQAKRWLHTVGRREVAELRGSLQPHAHGAIVTTSFYSRAANLEASDPVKKPIVLVNGVEFAAILVKSGRAFKA